MNNSFKKIVGILGLLGILILMFTLADNLKLISILIDIPSIIFLSVQVVSILLIADMLPDYIRGFKIIFGNTNFTTKELKTSSEAISLAIKVVYLFGIINLVVQTLIILSDLTDMNSFIYSFIFASYALFYGICLNILHYAVKFRLVKEIIYRGN